MLQNVLLWNIRHIKEDIFLEVSSWVWSALDLYLEQKLGQFVSPPLSTSSPRPAPSWVHFEPCSGRMTCTLAEASGGLRGLASWANTFRRNCAPNSGLDEFLIESEIISRRKKCLAYMFLMSLNVIVISCLAMSGNFITLCSDLNAPFLLNSALQPQLNFSIGNQTLGLVSFRNI